MICAVMQPTYIPWMGYFNMIDKSDVFVFLNNVKISKQSWQVRNRIKGISGEIMLTIPTASGRNALICDTKIDIKKNWRESHLKSIQHSYSKAPAFNSVFPVICEFYSMPHDNLSNFNIDYIKLICNHIGIEKTFILSVDLDVSGKKDELVMNICKKIGANKYLSAMGSYEYINRSIQGGCFPENDIELFYFVCKHPVYPQLFGEFIPYMSILDLLFNVGFEKSLSIIRSCDSSLLHYKDEISLQKALKNK